MFKKIILSLLIFSFLGIVQAQANLPEPGMLPGHALYFLKSWTENIATAFTFGEANKAERFFNLAEKRLAEVKALTEQERTELAERGIKRYEKQMQLALQRAEQAKEKGISVDEILSRVSEATLRHQGVLADVYEKVPEQAKEAIERAIQASRQGHEQALQAISEENVERVRQEIQEKKQEIKQRIETLRPRIEERLPEINRPEINERMPETDIPEIDERIPEIDIDIPVPTR